MSKNVKDSLAKKSNPHGFTADTSRRFGGGQHPADVSEVHNSKKGERIGEERRYIGASEATLENSPGRASSDASKRDR